MNWFKEIRSIVNTKKLAYEEHVQNIKIYTTKQLANANCSVEEEKKQEAIGYSLAYS